MTSQMTARHFRTLFISDVHLGSKAAQAELLVDFLRVHDAETIYLVGDIVDGWRLKRSWHWPQLHNDVVQKLLRKARKGSRIVYIPGNHDEMVRPFSGMNFGGVEIARAAFHDTAFFEHNNFIGILHGRKAMSDHQRRPAARRFVERALNGRLRCAVER